MRRRRDIRLVVTIFAAVALSLFLPCLGIAGSLEPPSYAVDGSGNPVPTMTTPPAWAQILPASERFVTLKEPCTAYPCIISYWGVLDRETGLVWEKSPSTEIYTWANAQVHCKDLQVANQKGWHLPTVEQLTSLTVLPTGHPFTNVQLSSFYWSATGSHTYTNSAIVVRINDGYLTASHKDDGTWNVWCVRGGQSYDEY